MKNVVVIDIDGTISSPKHRAINIKDWNNVDWDEFYKGVENDRPIKPILSIVEALMYCGKQIVFCTSRHESIRAKTEQWLFRNIPFRNYILLMRPNDDLETPCEELKPRMMLNQGIGLCDIDFVIEDKQEMVDRWTELGVMCLKVADVGY